MRGETLRSLPAPSYGARVDALLERLGGDLTERDFALLAVACADQAGLAAREQARLTTQLEDAAIRTLLGRTTAECVKDDCRVALGELEPRAYQTREQARARCAEETALMAEGRS